MPVRPRRAAMRKFDSLSIPQQIMVSLADTPSNDAHVDACVPINNAFSKVTSTLVGGETIVEIGCGCGLQSIEMARRVGPRGRVVSIDSFPDAINAARRNAAAAGLDNIDFFLCRVDSVPLPTGAADLIISEGVFCPSSGKMAVFREMYRVLAPGGKIVIHDIAIRKLLPPEIADSIAAFTFGLAGAIELSSYRKLLSSTGFVHCDVIESNSNSHLERFWDASAPNPICGHKPADASVIPGETSDRHWLHEYITGIRLQACKPVATAIRA